jgi:hypothetical protein
MDDTLAIRYEMKYFITPEQEVAIRRFIAPFVRPDKYSALHSDLRYRICSLYYDSYDLKTCKQTLQGIKNRFKLRIRRYSDDPSVPIFLEVKNRITTVLKKERLQITHDEAMAFIDASKHDRYLPIQGHFSEKMQAIQAKPLLCVKYFREAYESTGHDPVRITFDTDVKCHTGFNGEFKVAQAEWDRVPLDGHILEIKFTNIFPSWVELLVQQNQLYRQSIPKYVHSVQHAYKLGKLQGHITPDSASFLGLGD